MIAIAGKMTGPIWRTFFERTHWYPVGDPGHWLKNHGFCKNSAGNSGPSKIYDIKPNAGK